MLALAAAAIHLDQIGFRLEDPKQAVIVTTDDRPIEWKLVAADGRVVLRGRAEPLGLDAASGDRVQLATFTAAGPGTYTMRAGGAATPPFRIADDTFRPLALDALNFFYQQRAGTPILARWAGARWARAAGHAQEVATCFAGTDQRGNVWPACPYRLDVTGGWYDAGDHGKYVVNAGISVWTLQNLYEAGFARRLFADGNARLPEAGNGRDDLLDEARWEIEWLLRMQVAPGTRLSLPVGDQDPDGRLTLTRVDAGGMSFHKVADRNWTGLPTPPAADREERLLYPPSTAATLNLAAVAAQAARLWRTIDPAFAARCLAAATAAWAAAERNPRILAAQGFAGSGGYGDKDLTDERSWAAAELFATTGNARFRALLPTGAPDAPSWNSTATLGIITLAAAVGVPADLADGARGRIIAIARSFLAETPQTGYRIPYSTLHYRWGSNPDILNRAMLLGLASRFTGDARYRAGVINAADYILGRNPLGQSYVSGFGWQPMRNPHHRYWAASLDASLPPPPPGVLSGGPNNMEMTDPIARKLEGRCAPQRCWVDKAGAFTFNEVAINWNAPLVWIAAYLDSGIVAADKTPAATLKWKASSR